MFSVVFVCLSVRWDRGLSLIMHSEHIRRYTGIGPLLLGRTNQKEPGRKDARHPPWPHPPPSTGRRNNEGRGVVGTPPTGRLSRCY